MAKFRFILAALVFTAFVSSAAFADNFKDALAAAQRGDFETAFKLWKPLAERGNADAQYNLGVMYEKGNGVTKNDAEAVKWYRKAAEQGHTIAQYNLGIMYEKGNGVAEDDAEAVKWYRKAAQFGHAYAQYNLGMMYANGKGVAKDGTEALKWFRKAAIQGDTWAQNKLGTMYRTGEGVAVDNAEALKWFRKAAEQGLAVSQFNLGNMYENGDGIVKDDAEALKWYYKAAEQGFELAQTALAALNSKGASQLPSLPNLESVLELRPEELAEQYLAIENTVSFIETMMPVTETLNFHTFDGQDQEITKSNSDIYVKYWHDRLDLDRQAIEKLGSLDIAGRYSIVANTFCKGEKLDPREFFATDRRDGKLIMAEELVIRQNGFKADIIMSINQEGKSEEVTVSGITVGKGAAFGDAMSGVVFLATVNQPTIQLSLDAILLKNASGAEAGTEADWQSITKCFFTLTRE